MLKFVGGGWYARMVFGIYHRRFRTPPFVQAAAPWRYSTVWACLTYAPPLSTTADSVRLHLFRLSNRGDIVILVVCVLGFNLDNEYW